MSSEDHWKERQRNPSEFLLKAAESQVFGFFWGAYTACWLVCSLLCSSKRLRSTKVLQVSLVSSKSKLYCSKFCKSPQILPIRKAALFPAWCTQKALTFSIKVTFSLAMGETALCARSAASWAGGMGGQLGTSWHAFSHLSTSCSSKGGWWDTREAITWHSNAPFFYDWWARQNTPWKAHRIYS